MPSIILANITSDTPPGSVIGPGDSVVFTLDPGLLVNVVGSPQLALSNGEVASYIGNDVNGNPQFRYTVSAGDDTSDLQVLSVGLNGGTITLLGLPITLNLGLGTDTGIAIDTMAPLTPAAPTLAAASDTGPSSTDGITSDATPTFTGTAEAGSTVTLFDGTTQVGTATVGSNGTYSVTASSLADGAHALRVTATDAAGNVSASSGDVSITIDTSAPPTPAAPTLSAASDTGASSTDGITGDATPTFTGTAEVGSTVTLFDGSTVVGTATVAGNGAYSVTASPLADGSHALSVTITDAAGNTSPGSAPVSITIDTSAPATPATPTLTAASDTGASSTDGITGDATPTFTGTAEVGSTVTLFDGSTAVGTATVGANGTYSVTASTLGEGLHSLSVTVADAAGNTSPSSAPVSITIDTSGPSTPAAPTLTSASDTGASSTDGVTGDATPTFTGTADVGSTVTLFDGSTAVGTATVGANGTYSVTASTLGDGSHSLSVTVADAAGNTSPSSAPVSITIDTSVPSTPTAPTLAAGSDTGASSTDGITGDATPTFTGTAEVGSTVTLFDGSTAVGTATVGANGTYSVTASTLGDGAHSLSVTVADDAGNTSAGSPPVSITIDTSGPATPAAPTLSAASDTGASSTDGITSDATPTFTGTAEVGSTVTLFDGSTVVGTATVAGNGAYSVTASTLGDGAHSLSVTITDAAGNTSPGSTPVNISIDTSAPATPATPTLTAASDTGASSTDGITSDATPTFTGTADVGSTVTLFDGSTAVGTATVGANGAYSVTASALADGAHALSVTVTDAAGNISASSADVSVTIDTRAPARPTTPRLAPASDTGKSAADRITSDATPTFTGTATVGSTVTLYDGATAVGAATVGANGLYAVTASTLADGAHTLYVTATDAAGNVSASSADVSVTIDTAAPARPAAPTLAAAFDTGASSTDGLTRDTTPTFTGTAEAGSIVTLTVDTAVVGTTTVRADGTYSVTSSAVADGSHVFNVKVTDTAGNVSQPSTGTRVRIDTSAPAAPSLTLAVSSDTGSSSSDSLTKDGTPTFTGTAEAGSTITLYDGFRKVGTAKVLADGTYKVTSSTLTDGVHALRVTATDSTGNIGPSSADVNVTIDKRAPTRPLAPTLVAASDTGRSSRDVVTSDTTPTFTGRAEAGSTVTLFDGTTRTVVGTTTAGADGTYSVTASAIADGTHIFNIRATDAAGNVSQYSTGKRVVIDTRTPSAPSIALASTSDTGSSSSDGLTSDTTPTFTGVAEAGSTVTLYDGSTKVGTTTAQDDGSYKVFASALTNGAHALRVAATDLAGNAGPTSAVVNITIDAKAPAQAAAPTLAAASDTGGSSRDGITSDATPTFAGKAEAGSTVILYDGTRTMIGSAVAGSDGNYTITASGLADGAHSIRVGQVDAAGNVSALSGGRRVVIDTQAPSVSITNSGGATAQASQTITGTAEAGTFVTITDNGEVVGRATVGVSGKWNSKVTLSSGTNNIVATDTDKAGNVGTSQTVAFEYTPAASANASSLNSMVQAMSTMTPSSSASMTPTASAPPAEAHPLAAAH